jgi:hypothetical protein
MNADVLFRMQELGADTSAVDDSAPLAGQLGSITFNRVLFDDCWECYGVNKFLEQNKDLYKNDRETFVERLLDHLFANNDEPRGQMFWRPVRFAPLTPGSDDQKEWSGIFDDLDLSEITDVTGDGILEFVQIIESYGYPDHYYICLSDPNPDNPIVFGTDHEEFFTEITNEGTLKEFLDNLMSRSDLKRISMEYLAAEHPE